ncbi:M protein [Tibrovirus congo]|uniref:M protein n=1 Tax=Tibrovirus congo TaxID=1987017 RepID=K0A121_9RHAB|nr:M protein [Tibrovirus congo]AFS65340.1 M protein [Tibrovirus congo]
MLSLWKSKKAVNKISTQSIWMNDPSCPTFEEVFIPPVKEDFLQEENAHGVELNLAFSGGLELISTIQLRSVSQILSHLEGFVDLSEFSIMKRGIVGITLLILGLHLSSKPGQTSGSYSYHSKLDAVINVLVSPDLIISKTPFGVRYGIETAELGISISSRISCDYKITKRVGHRVEALYGALMSNGESPPELSQTLKKLDIPHLVQEDRICLQPSWRS